MGPALDATGQVVAFSSRHAVAATDRGDDFDLFVRALTPPALVKRQVSLNRTDGASRARPERARGALLARSRAGGGRLPRTAAATGARTAR